MTKSYLHTTLDRLVADLQYQLGHSFSVLSVGDRQANLRRAIACYQKALQTYNPADFPRQWASTLRALGNAYQDLPLGDRQTNLEDAIKSYQQALEIFTHDAYPLEWAQTQYVLGNAYYDLQTGDHQANVLNAIACYQHALQVYRQERTPYEWAETEYALGRAYYCLPEGDLQENLEKAIRCLQEAQQIFTRAEYPYWWAQTQYELGRAYANLGKEGKQSYVQQALDSYQQALQILTPEAYPLEWAQTQHALGQAYRNLTAGSSQVNLEKAIEAYQQALQIFVSEVQPVEWAKVQSSLGDAYIDLIGGNRHAHLSKAVAAYQDALKVYNVYAPSSERKSLRRRLDQARVLLANSTEGTKALDSVYPDYSAYIDFQKKRDTLASLAQRQQNALSRLNWDGLSRNIQQVVMATHRAAFKVAVTGEFKSGKSAFINAMLGQDILPVNTLGQQTFVTEIKWGEEPRAVVHFRSDGGSVGGSEDVPLDQIGSDLVSGEQGTMGDYEKIEIFSPADLCRYGVEFMDTPSLNGNDTLNARVINSLSSTDAVVFLARSDAPLSSSTLRIVEMLRQLDAENVFFVVNGVDRIAPALRDRFEQNYRSTVLRVATQQRTNRIFFTSALNALEARLEEDAEQLQRSGLPAIEEALEHFLTQERGQRKLLRLISPLKGATNTAQRTITERRHLLSSEQDRIEALAAQTQQRRFHFKEETDQATKAIADLIEGAVANVSNSVRHFYEDVAGRIQEWAQTYTFSHPIALLPFSNERLREAAEELKEFLDGKVSEETSRWITSTLEPYLASRLGYVSEILQRLGEISDIVAPIEVPRAEVLAYAAPVGIAASYVGIITSTKFVGIITSTKLKKIVSQEYERTLRSQIPRLTNIIVDGVKGRLNGLRRAVYDISEQLEHRFKDELVAISSVKMRADKGRQELEAISQELEEIDAELDGLMTTFV